MSTEGGGPRKNSDDDDHDEMMMRLNHGARMMVKDMQMQSKALRTGRSSSALHVSPIIKSKMTTRKELPKRGGGAITPTY